MVAICPYKTDDFILVKSPNSAYFIARHFPLHEFVIDIKEARNLFERVKETSDIENQISDSLKEYAKYPQDDPQIMLLSTAKTKGEKQDVLKGQIDPEGNGDQIKAVKELSAKKDPANIEFLAQETMKLVKQNI